MNPIRLKITIHLNGNHALSVHQLKAFQSPIERDIAPKLDRCRYDQRYEGGGDEDSCARMRSLEARLDGSG